MVEKQGKKQTSQEVFIQTLIDEISQKTANIAQLNATIYELSRKYEELLDKYHGMPENHSNKK